MFRIVGSSELTVPMAMTEDFAASSSSETGGTNKPALGAALALGVGGFGGAGRGVSVETRSAGFCKDVGVTEGLAVPSADGDDAGTGAHAAIAIANIHNIETAYVVFLKLLPRIWLIDVLEHMS